MDAGVVLGIVLPVGVIASDSSEQDPNVIIRDIVAGNYKLPTVEEIAQMSPAVVLDKMKDLVSLVRFARKSHSCIDDFCELPECSCSDCEDLTHPVNWFDEKTITALVKRARQLHTTQQQAEKVVSNLAVCIKNLGTTYRAADRRAKDEIAGLQDELSRKMADLTRCRRFLQKFGTVAPSTHDSAEAAECSSGLSRLQQEALDIVERNFAKHCEPLAFQFKRVETAFEDLKKLIADVPALQNKIKDLQLRISRKTLELEQTKKQVQDVTGDLASESSNLL